MLISGIWLSSKRRVSEFFLSLLFLLFCDTLELFSVWSSSSWDSDILNKPLSLRSVIWINDVFLLILGSDLISLLLDYIDSLIFLTIFWEWFIFLFNKIIFRSFILWFILFTMPSIILTQFMIFLSVFVSLNC